MATIRGLPQGSKVNFSDEAEVYGPIALENGLIERYLQGCSFIAITNTGQTNITIAPGYAGTIDSANDQLAEEFAGIPLAAAGADGMGGGYFFFDTATNSASINKVRAIVHGGGAGQLSIWAI